MFLEMNDVRGVSFTFKRLTTDREHIPGGRRTPTIKFGHIRTSTIFPFFAIQSD